MRRGTGSGAPSVLKKLVEQFRQNALSRHRRVAELCGMPARGRRTGADQCTCEARLRSLKVRVGRRGSSVAPASVRSGDHFNGEQALLHLDSLVMLLAGGAGLDLDLIARLLTEHACFDADPNVIVLVAIGSSQLT